MSKFMFKCFKKCQKGLKSCLQSISIDRLPQAEAQGADSPYVVKDFGDRAVVYKPQGWEVYGGHTLRQLSRFLLAFNDLPILRDERHQLGFLHRLDVPSSGLIMVSKSYEAFYDLQFQLHLGVFQRDYDVMAHGLLSRPLIEARSMSRGAEMASKCGRGKWGCSEVLRARFLFWRGRGRGLSRLRLRIVTGRKHQIRSHLSFMGHPTVRDALYSSESTFEEDGGLCMRNWLHRERLVFETLGQQEEVKSPLPHDLQRSLKLLQGFCEAVARLRKDGTAAAQAESPQLRVAMAAEARWSWRLHAPGEKSGKRCRDHQVDLEACET